MAPQAGVMLCQLRGVCVSSWYKAYASVGSCPFVAVSVMCGRGAEPNTWLDQLFKPMILKDLGPIVYIDCQEHNNVRH